MNFTLSSLLDYWQIPLSSSVLPWLEFAPMLETDLPTVNTLEQAVYTAPWPQSAYRQELLNPNAFLDLLKYRSIIIGYTAMWCFINEIHLGTIVSHPMVRGNGIGELLLLNVITRSIAFNADLITLEVRPSNHTAINLYTKYHFKEVGYRKKYYSDLEDALIMTVTAINTPAYYAAIQPVAQSLSRRILSFQPLPVLYIP